MNTTKTFYLLIVLVLLAVSDVTFFGIVRAGEVPDGFAGIPWGANTNQITKAMRERGYKEFTGEPKPGELKFDGDFAGVPCLLLFDLTANSFYSGSADYCAKSPYRQFPQSHFETVVNKLNAKYGPPQNRKSFVNENGGGAELLEKAQWTFVDSDTSDNYSIDVLLFRSSFFDGMHGSIQYFVSITYQADSLKKNLEMKEF